jgi:integrase
MSVIRDVRDGRWRYRKTIRLPNGRSLLISGTPAISTKVAAEAAEREHIRRALDPATESAVKKEVPTFAGFAEEFMASYVAANNKPSEQEAKVEPEWRTAIVLAADAGLRMGEVLALEWGDIDLNGGGAHSDALGLARADWIAQGRAVTQGAADRTGARRPEGASSVHRRQGLRRRAEGCRRAAPPGRAPVRSAPRSHRGKGAG